MLVHMACQVADEWREMLKDGRVQCAANLSHSAWPRGLNQATRIRPLQPCGFYSTNPKP